MTTPRALPGTLGKCRRCNGPVVWARTMASPNGPGGKAMPLDPLENLTGNAAVRETGRHSAVVRILGKDESIDLLLEVRAMPHFATCQPTLPDPPPELPANVVDFAQARRDRGARQ